LRDASVYRESFPANFSVLVHPIGYILSAHVLALHSEAPWLRSVHVNVNEPNEAPSELVEQQQQQQQHHINTLCLSLLQNAHNKVSKERQANCTDIGNSFFVWVRRESSAHFCSCSVRGLQQISHSAIKHLRKLSRLYDD